MTHKILASLILGAALAGAPAGALACGGLLKQGLYNTSAQVSADAEFLYEYSLNCKSSGRARSFSASGSYKLNSFGLGQSSDSRSAYCKENKDRAERQSASYSTARTAAAGILDAYVRCKEIESRSGKDKVNIAYESTADGELVTFQISQDEDYDPSSSPALSVVDVTGPWVCGITPPQSAKEIIKGAVLIKKNGNVEPQVPLRQRALTVSCRRNEGEETIAGVSRKVRKAGSVSISTTAMGGRIVVDFPQISEPRVPMNAAELEAEILNLKRRARAEFCGLTPSKTNGNMGGYKGAKQQCERACGSAEARMCTSDEMAVAAQSGALPNEGAWYATFATDLYLRHPNATRSSPERKILHKAADCEGWSSTTDNMFGLTYEADGSGNPRPQRRECKKKFKVACCAPGL